MSSVAIVALSWVGLHAYLNSDGVREAMRARLVRALGDRAKWVRLGDQLQVDWLGRVAFGPVSIAEAPDKPPLVAIEQVRVRPSYRALLRGEAQPSTVVLEGAKVDATSGAARLRALVARLRDAEQRRRRPVEEPGQETPARYLRVRLESLRVQLAPDTEAYGPLDAELSLWSDPDGRRVRGAVELPGGGVVRVDARHTPTELSGQVRVEALSAEAVPALVRERLPIAWSGGELAASIGLRGDARGKEGTVTVDVGSDALEFSGERLAPEPVRPVAFDVHLEAKWARSGRAVQLERSRLALGPGDPFEIGLDGSISWDGDPHFRLDARVAAEPYAHFLAAVPRALQPDDTAPKVKGTITASAHLAGPVRRPHDWEVEAKLDLSQLDEAEPLYLKQPFSHRTPEVDGRSRELWVGDTNPHFVPVAELPNHVIRAVTTSEDAGFFAHRGFDLLELKDSVIAAAEARRVRGASTITQQLAKNLFLSREKTYARKVKEALITLALEGTLSKQRLLEIYLNIIEWGPGIHGLGEASRYYFGVDPRELSIKQAAYLATIIPNPVRYHVYFARGELTDNWQRRLDDLLLKMFINGVITSEQYAEAQAAPLHFRPQG